MRSIGVLLVLTAVGLWSGCGSKPEEKKGPTNDPKEVDQLRGNWQVVAMESGGKTLPSDEVKKINLHYIFTNDKLMIRTPDGSEEAGTYLLDGTAQPKKITIQLKTPIKGIYEQDGNKLRLCLTKDADPKAGFPTELSSRASPHTDLITLERRLPVRTKPTMGG